MGTVHVHEFMTLDGVIENPSWTRDYGFDPQMGNAIGGIMQASRALLMGRNTYEMFAPSWSARTAAEDPGAPFMNDSPKYVVSGTLAETAWSNSTVIGAYDAGAIHKLIDGIEGGVYLSGSATLVRAMLADGLVDELHLFVYPLALGRGMRLFEDGVQARFTLARHESYANGVVYLAYRPAR
jgi:dihydrofolate reductase